MNKVAYYQSSFCRRKYALIVGQGFSVSFLHDTSYPCNVTMSGTCNLFAIGSTAHASMAK
jgi:hypothetical protein